MIDAVQSVNQNAGTLTLEDVPKDICRAFNTRQNPHWISDVKKLKDHSDYIINGIRSNIGGVHIKRSNSFEQLLEISEGAEFVFLSGGRGYGKSSLLREFAEYMKDHAPIFCLRTEDLDKAHLDNVFSTIGLTSSLSELEAGFALMPKKYLLIESLEKLLELQNSAAFTGLIQFVRRHLGWTIIASGLDYAYQQILFNFLQPTGVHCSTLVIRGFADEEIQYLCEKLESLKLLLTNDSIKPLLKNPFFADLAYRVVETGTQFSSSDGEREFRIAVWRDVISREQMRMEGMPLKRKQAFIDIEWYMGYQKLNSSCLIKFSILLKLHEVTITVKNRVNEQNAIFLAASQMSLLLFSWQFRPISE
ncbi:hypothetical protein ACFOU2_19755 [Bacillus songklensis]|uniref:Orc1-like AAA ATPase domain-containing protein n=1 Tax=Bacillus songklensis TaxID=1069116 RepID=A0ABV8B5K5_9BACI